MAERRSHRLPPGPRPEPYHWMDCLHCNVEPRAGSEAGKRPLHIETPYLMVTSMEEIEHKVLCVRAVNNRIAKQTPSDFLPTLLGAVDPVKENAITIRQRVGTAHQHIHVCSRYRHGRAFQTVQVKTAPKSIVLNNKCKRTRARAQSPSVHSAR